MTNLKYTQVGALPSIYYHWGVPLYSSQVCQMASAGIDYKGANMFQKIQQKL